MRTLIFLFMAFLFAFPSWASASSRVNPKIDPQNFRILYWTPESEKSGYTEEWQKDQEEFNEVLAQDFPVGTPKKEVDEYLLASRDLQVETKYLLLDSDREQIQAPKNAKTYASYWKWAHNNTEICGFFIDIYYDKDDLSLVLPTYKTSCSHPYAISSVPVDQIKKLPHSFINSPTIVDATPQNLVDTPWANLKKNPAGTVLIVEKAPNGKRKTLKFIGGVTISDDGLSMDGSGKGAVLCGWEIYVGVRNALIICGPEEEKELMGRLDMAIGRMNDFIVANSLAGDTKESLKAAEEKDLSQLRETISKKSKEDLEKWCTSGDMASFFKAFKSLPREKFEKALDDSLSIHRPPVINPCL